MARGAAPGAAPSIAARGDGLPARASASAVALPVEGRWADLAVSLSSHVHASVEELDAQLAGAHEVRSLVLERQRRVEAGLASAEALAEDELAEVELRAALESRRATARARPLSVRTPHAAETAELLERVGGPRSASRCAPRTAPAARSRSPKSARERPREGEPPPRGSTSLARALESGAARREPQSARRAARADSSGGECECESKCDEADGEQAAAGEARAPSAATPATLAPGALPPRPLGPKPDKSAAHEAEWAHGHGSLRGGQPEEQRSIMLTSVPVHPDRARMPPRTVEFLDTLSPACHELPCKNALGSLSEICRDNVVRVRAKDLFVERPTGPTVALYLEPPLKQSKARTGKK
jgi:hypothetical protein